MFTAKYCFQSFTALLAGLLLVLPPLPAQINTGKITGVVQDASGGSIPDVDITATNEETGVVTQTKSSGNGDYLLNFLMPGKYKVQVEKPGFQKAAQLGVVVNAGAIARIDLTLRVGDILQTVEVVANSLSVETETSELSQTFNMKDLERLPNLDRNPVYIMNLMPGAYNGPGSGDSLSGGENGSMVGMSRPQRVSLGGMSARATSYYIEGTINREPQNNYMGVVMPVEAVQEVQIYTGKYNAEYGFSGNAVVNFITKSGTNALHGALFEYLRNEKADARNFFSDSKTPFKKNQFGGALGGPIEKNKLFFFGDYQGTYYRSSGTGFTSVPSDNMYQGNFSELYDLSQRDGAGNTLGQIYDPFTRAFDAKGNVIAATPFPGNIIPRSRWDPVAQKINDDFVFGKANRPGIDNNLYYVLGNRQNVYQADGRVDYNLSAKDRFFFRYSNLKSSLDNRTSVNDFWQGGNADSNTLNQNMQLTHMRIFSPTKMNEFRLGFNRTNVVTSTKSMAKPWNNYYGIKNGNLGDGINQGIFELTALAPIHNIGDPDWVAFVKSNSWSITENFTWVKGRHNTKFGTSINKIASISADPVGNGDDPRGAFSFDPAMTSYDGNAPPYAYPSFLLGLPVASMRSAWVSGTPYQTYWQTGWYAQDDFKVLPSLTLNLGLRYDYITNPVERYNRQANWDVRTNQLVVATKDNRTPSLQVDRKNWGPRLGFAWSPDHGKTSLRGGFGIAYWVGGGSGGPLSYQALTYPIYAYTVMTADNNLIPSLSLARDGLPLATAEYDSQGKLLIPQGAFVRGEDYYWRNQRTDQISFNLERQIRPGMVLDVGYLSVHARNNNVSTININQAPPGPANVDYNLRRPLYNQYPTLGDLFIQFSRGQSFYDALTARFTGNIGKYAYVYASYAHGRNFADGNNINPNDLEQYYGPTQQDIHHIFNSAVNIRIPVGRGKAFLSNMNRGLDSIFGGWEFSGFISIRSGTRFGVSSPVSLLHNGQSNRPDRIGDGNLPPSQRTLWQWYDTTAFVNNLQEQTYGNAGTNPLFADGLEQLDSSISKTFKITERYALQFRADFFNTFNHPDFSAPNANVGSSTNGVVSSTVIDGRRAQFGLRLSF